MLTGNFDTGAWAKRELPRAGRRAKKTAGRMGPWLPVMNVLGLIDISKKKMRSCMCSFNVEQGRGLKAFCGSAHKPECVPG
jgi:hypothetical protein